MKSFICPILFQCPDSMAFFTTSSSVIFFSSIFFCEFMTMNAVSSLGFFTSFHIGFMRYSFQVFRINAMSYSAKMINFKSFTDFTFCKLIGYAMSGLRDFFNIKPAITLLTGSAFPKPTSFGFKNFFPESNSYCVHGYWLSIIDAGVK